jgi:hypothetical protein
MLNGWIHSSNNGEKNTKGEIKSISSEENVLFMNLVAQQWRKTPREI